MRWLVLGWILGSDPLRIESGDNHKGDEKSQRHAEEASEEHESLPLRDRPCFADEVDPPDKKHK